MSILRYFDSTAESGSAAFASPALRAAAAVSPTELFRIMHFSEEEITGLRNNLIGYGPLAVLDAEGKLLGDLIINKGMFVIDGSGRPRKLTKEDRIVTAQMTTLVQDSSREFTLNVEGNSWKEQIEASLPAAQAHAIRVTMPMPSTIRLQYPDTPNVRLDMPAYQTSNREMFTGARNITLVGFHAPNSNFPLPQGLHLRGIARRRDDVFVGGTPLSIEGKIQVEHQPIDDCRLIDKPKTPEAQAPNINKLFVELEC
jgi:hypothetical protein